MAQHKIPVIQLPSESMQDYVKFLVFLEMGATRNLNQAYKKYYESNNEVTPVWHVLADKNRWVDRASEHDKATQALHVK